MDELKLPALPPDIPVGLDSLNTTTAEGEPLSYAPENQLVVTATFLVPIDESLGDMTFFATNVTDEEYITFLTGNWDNGLESGEVGQPRMYGARVRYYF